MTQNTPAIVEGYAVFARDEALLAVVAVVAEHGGIDLEQADEFLSELRIERRYQRDVY